MILSENKAFKMHTDVLVALTLSLTLKEESSLTIHIAKI